jgi:hypothetical protein
MQATKPNQAMLRLRATTKERLRKIARENRWTLSEGAQAAVEALEQISRRGRYAQRRA